MTYRVGCALGSLILNRNTMKQAHEFCEGFWWLVSSTKLYTYIYICICIRIYVCIPLSLCLSLLECAYIHAFIHAYIHVCIIHMYMYTYEYVWVRLRCGFLNEFDRSLFPCIHWTRSACLLLTSAVTSCVPWMCPSPALRVLLSLTKLHIGRVGSLPQGVDGAEQGSVTYVYAWSCNIGPVQMSKASCSSFQCL